MDEKKYRKELWIYSVLVVLASVCGLGSPLIAGAKLSSVITWTLGIVAVVLFVFAMIKFGIALKLKGRQWAAAILLLVLAWTGSIIYMTTRKPNPPKAP